jgi:hypothetical protein
MMSSEPGWVGIGFHPERTRRGDTRFQSLMYHQLDAGALAVLSATQPGFHLRIILGGLTTEFWIKGDRPK